jgi:hypothetical protein
MPSDYDPLTEVRAERLRALVAELVPRIRSVSPEMTDEQVLAAAERMARYRLADEALGKDAL